MTLCVWRLGGKLISLWMGSKVSQGGEASGQAAGKSYPVLSGNVLVTGAGRDNYQTRAHDMRKVIE
jgi:hypothetical protein